MLNWRSKMKMLVFVVVLLACFGTSAAYAEGCTYGGQTYSDGAVVNGKVCDGRSGTWR